MQRARSAISIALILVLSSAISPFPGTYSFQRTSPPPTAIVGSGRFLSPTEGPNVVYIPPGSGDNAVSLQGGPSCVVSARFPIPPFTRLRRHEPWSPCARRVKIAVAAVDATATSKHQHDFRTIMSVTAQTEISCQPA